MQHLVHPAIVASLNVFFSRISSVPHNLSFVSALPDLQSGLPSILYWHVNVHDDCFEFSAAAIINARHHLLNFIDCLLPVSDLENFVLLLRQYLVETKPYHRRVVHDQHLRAIAAE